MYRPSICPLALLAALVRDVSASALTTMVAPHERSCFYADVDRAGEKIGFYFAVQAGGAFDIDFFIQDPNEKLILDGQGERQGDFVLTANTIGEYSFCFENSMSAFAEKLLDIDIMVESEPRREPPAKQQQISEQTSALEESIYKLNGMLSNIERTQRYFHTRERRSFDTVESTKKRLLWYGLLETVAIITMAVFQVFILQNFFNRSRRYKV
ncbi:hypothetical protein DACRYDRAFT_24624 [Dacryopinax primogenitus]|uniref:GOLD domain-containing protein n=1 Tax=Dacryopinax primogenitus (strain DJM 731) TaxID=1858805 RepID=M5FNZ8_DACPD|nr:uncharacterized protein DACRYDRAFT_24624 [Dacryopinax primogenitus]EJT98100.1 hypothetical protein DACRYDRAFT_24624 [Dacryopinax primogenitus]